MEKQKYSLGDHYIHAWIQENEIKNEKGDLIDFIDHPFLFHIYEDQSQNLVVKKAAQVGLSTLEIIKNIYDAKHTGLDIIYTLPTDSDVEVFVGGKVNRIISNNPIMQSYTSDKDTIMQKQIFNNMVYFRGTWTKKAAIMVTADRLVHDEKDSSKQDVVADYKARLQHSKFRQIHSFSHPSTPNTGVDVEWQMSDQKEWIISCFHCGKKQFLEWNTVDDKKMSVDIEKEIFICKFCKKEITNDNRRKGMWLARKGKADAEWSGYHVSLLMAPWVTAGEIIKKYNEVLAGKQTMDYFYNKVLGEPYAGSGNSVTEEQILGAISKEKNNYKGRMVIGVDTGVALRYVIGNKQGLLGYGQMKDYCPDEKNGLRLEETLEYFLKKFENSIMVIDQGGDIIGSRKLAAAYPGRVFLCHYAQDRKTMQLIRWGSADESGNVLADRNRMIQLVIGEITERRIGLYGGSREDWYDYWLHWSHIYRTVEMDALEKPKYVWHRSDRDDWVHATIYYRIGLDKFGDGGAIVKADEDVKPNSYFINPDNTVSFNPKEMFINDSISENEGDWRD